MDHETLLKAGFVAFPLVILGLWLIPLRPALRVAAALALGAALALLLSVSLTPGNLAYLTSFATMAGIYAILTLGLNIQWGYTGHLNFGIAGFFAVGAFTTALFTTSAPTGTMAQYTQQAFGLEMPFLVGIAAAAVISGVVALLIAVPVLRLRMDFLAIATIGIAEIIRRIFQNERWLANGPQPLRGIPQPGRCLFEDGCGWSPEWLIWLLGPLEQRDYNFFYLIIVTLFVVAIYWLAERAVRSPWGRMLRATRDEESSTAMSGKNVPWVRIQSFVFGAIIMGIGGAIYAHYVITIDYSHFRPLFATFLVWVMLMLGGSGNNRGALLGAFVVWGVWSGTAFLAGALEPVLAAIHSELPERANYLRWLFVALLLAGIVLFRPQGILAEETVVSRYAFGSRRRGRIHARNPSPDETADSPPGRSGQ
ncbi:branched-chain amino acid ABC transporter permease [Halofilum ochraceum]|uniref:branched-chain amino acid ABC transporter permease n=1 Tax=Halofilum ochraceum TaxID=1611323 RepID=UPI000833A171|nr:branched-chain amino acid ABC transporter permease [Halofilum ochraceum]